MSSQNSHKIETTQMFIVGWMGKHNMILHTVEYYSAL